MLPDLPVHQIGRTPMPHLLGRQPEPHERGAHLEPAAHLVDEDTGEWLVSNLPGFGAPLAGPAWDLEEGWLDPDPGRLQPWADLAGLGPALRGLARTNLHATTYHYDRPFEECSTLLFVYRRGDPYEGGETVLPELGLYLDLGDGDAAVIHSQRLMHGNLPRKMGPTSERLLLMIHVPGLPL